MASGMSSARKRSSVIAALAILTARLHDMGGIPPSEMKQARAIAFTRRSLNETAFTR